MKIKFITLLLILSRSIVSQAQTFADVFKEETEITWLGLDFTGLKVIRDEINWSQRTPSEMFKLWNRLMILETEKYDVGKTLHHKETVKQAVEVALEHNANLKVDDSNFFKDAPSNDLLLTTEKVKSIVSSYDYKANKGIGFMIVMETFDKTVAKATMWVTFINMNTKEILYTQRMSGRPTGWGLRNYWASCIYAVMKEIKSTQYRKWAKSIRKRK